MIRMIHADARRLPLADKSVHCCVTSPPYWGLRDYGTARWEGGDAACDHAAPNDAPNGNKGQPQTHAGRHNGDCRKCGARRVDAQLGLEPTPEEYVANMVEVFREVRRVLRDDGTCWLNLGASYSSAMTNTPDCLNRVLKGCSIFGFDAETVASPSKRVTVSAHDKRPPNSELPRLLGSERECVEQRDNHFGEVVNCLAVPRHGWPRVVPAGLMLGGASAPHAIQNVVDGCDIVFADLDANLQAKLTVLRTPSARSGHGDDAAFAVEEARKPGTEAGVAWHATWDSFATASAGKSIPDVDLVNQAVSLRNGALSFACPLRDFEITQSSEKKITFTSVNGCVRLVVSDVSHLMFSFTDGSIVPYRALYDKAIRLSNRNCAKQEIDTPNMVKTALQEDGWICRQTIIWHKPNPMPESVTDRCTKAHEYVFLLAKSARYFYDNIAIAEESHGRTNDTTNAREIQKVKEGTGVLIALPKIRQKEGCSPSLLREREGKGDHCEISSDREGPRVAIKRSSQTEIGTVDDDLRSYVRPVDEDQDKPKIPLCDLRGGETADQGSHHSTEVGRAAHGSKRSSVVSKLQQQEERLPTRNRRSVWTVATQPYSGAHFATFPLSLVEPMIKAGCPKDGIVFDPFGGAGTTALAAWRLGRSAILTELNPEYIKLARQRLADAMGPLASMIDTLQETK